MSLAFDSAVANTYVDFGSAAGVDDIDPLTCIAWAFPTGQPQLGRILAKGGPTQLAHDGSAVGTHRLRFFRMRATTNAVSDSVDNTITLNSWQFFACAFDSAAGSPQLYRGTLNSPPAEVSYTTQTNGSGALTSDAASSLTIGNELTTLGDPRGFKGRIALAAVIPAKLSGTDLVRIWHHWLAVMSHAPRGMWLLGYNGTGTQPDWSGNGNAGTVTGATVADHVPLRPVFAFDAPMLPMSVIAAGGKPWQHYARQRA